MPPQPQQQDDKRQAAREVIDILHEISTILCLSQNTHLDRTELSLCVSLIENGVNPEALAAVIKELRREAVAAAATTSGAAAAVE
ncbi:hypothetical protein RJZ56_002486 [Blastomyces dermatitidis]|uniref:Mitotic-spindle organizing protein 1 n=3 Tax=Blastomyces TaxID=229219 RepID=A0A179UL64_BLAGS|nr:mitotic-spindle organizing protein 1 [Blastomyces gilchristii SLH14081]XP_045279870.1 mitotic-spindle organizing protein 1 [Blastomyces dermatitidis ER-3]EGE87102.2 mitotic-spindle organizing protein 1 [Blastomyces dermatitidis ATCC 18188]EQL27804.1 mitotic-spindle organizing protein 1 [Blastomyces dermatitidis ATCC 26199]OAT00143.1 mitotic-spindle organizing protein 1 [Blastomyces dermatitidis ER-3]OAT07887.1 mitotic-spindle organizing protein 1 [Blastomyces gilchristii SLH14081]